MMRIGSATLRKLQTPRRSLFLGIITPDDEIILERADAHSLPGHADWLRRAPGVVAKYGFAVSGCRGRVEALYRPSRLNAAKDEWLLPMQAVKELLAVLPVADDVTVYEH